MNYYNENDRCAAQWLRELIRAVEIPDGFVDDRSIAEVQPDDLSGFTQCHFFAGIGGWPLALKLAGWPADKPAWTGSCPCQPFSAAGKQKGINDERHLWPVWFKLIAARHPQFVFGEQVAGAIGHGWIDGVCADLEREGYASGFAVLGAHSVGASHIRQRLYWMAHSERAAGIEGRIANRSTEGDGTNRAGALPKSGRSGDPRGVGDTSGNNECWTRESNSSDGQKSAIGRPSSGCAGGLGHADQSGSQGLSERGNGASERTAGPAGLGCWQNFDVIPCLDGKARRIESKHEPLASGISALLDDLRNAGASETQIAATTETFPIVRESLGRVMLLRGYGNAICIPAAVEFIRASMKL